MQRETLEFTGAKSKKPIATAKKRATIAAIERNGTRETRNEHKRSSSTEGILERMAPKPSDCLFYPL